MQRDEVEKPVVFDNIYGFVYLTHDEGKLVDSPYFHRLRYIKQLGMAYYVFPGALHTRFSHSIGVLHIVCQIIDTLNKVNADSIDEHTKKLLRVAALLHDIAQYPLSHTIEQSYIWIQNLENKAKESKLIDRSKGSDIIDYAGKPSNLSEFFLADLSRVDRETKNAAHHEQLAETVITTPEFLTILKDIDLSEDDVGQIIRFIKGDYQGNTLATSIINSLLDADKLDYMVRDAHFTGVKIGVFDIDNILRKIDIVKDKLEGTGEEYECLGVHIDAIQSIENFLLANYFWYTQIIYHPSVLIFDEIAKHLYFHLIHRGYAPNFEEIQNWVTNPIQYFKFSDRLFWNVIDNYLEDEKDTDSILYKMAVALVFRNKPDYIRRVEWDGLGLFSHDVLGTIKEEKMFFDVRDVVDRAFIDDLKKAEGEYWGINKRREIFEHRIDHRNDPGAKIIRIFDDPEKPKDFDECKCLFEQIQKTILSRYALYKFTDLLK